jgi:hypothetical protein
MTWDKFLQVAKGVVNKGRGKMDEVWSVKVTERHRFEMWLNKGGRDFYYIWGYDPSRTESQLRTRLQFDMNDLAEDAKLLNECYDREGK